MEFNSLIPTLEAIPAPAWLFLVLDVALFLLHILLINILLGGSLIAFFTRKKGQENAVESRLIGAVADKIPTTFALGVNLGVAPLLFVQVIYGNLFYSSSILLGVYWILIIPLLIMAYYGSYIHIKKYHNYLLSQVAIGITALIALYIGFIQVNNNTLMIQPEKWSAYFSNRGGTILNWSDPTLIPRYLHFVIASIAIAGIFMSLVWDWRQRQNSVDPGEKVHTGLKIFAYATVAQVVIGLWFLLALPNDYMLAFMGRNLPATIFFMLGFLAGIGCIATAFAGKLRPTVIMLLVTMVAMIITRAFLREMYLAGKHSIGSLELVPQYGVMTLFFIILLIGLASVGYMLKAGFSGDREEVTA